jgi:hypothetical protein
MLKNHTRYVGKTTIICEVFHMLLSYEKIARYQEEEGNISK